MAYSLGLIVPFFGKPEVVQKEFASWLNKTEVSDRFTSLGINPDHISFRHLSPNDVLDEQGLRFKDRTPKGVCIASGIRELKKTENPEIYVCIDGDGIPREYIYDAILTLQTNPAEAVLAHRVSEYKGISDKRLLQEEFELSILSNIFGCDLPDGQCGCWGFKREVLSKFKPEAVGFEIELDFLTQLLTNRIPFAYFPVELKRGEEKTDKEETTYTYEDDIAKLKFIAERTGRDKYELLAHAKRFKDETGKSLPSEYIKLFDKIKYDKLPPRICYVTDC